MLTSILIGILGTQEIILIAVVVILLFGGKKVPELMKGLGKGIHEFNKAKEGISQETRELIKKD